MRYRFEYMREPYRSEWAWIKGETYNTWQEATEAAASFLRQEWVESERVAVRIGTVHVEGE